VKTFHISNITDDTAIWDLVILFPLRKVGRIRLMKEGSTVCAQMELDDVSPDAQKATKEYGSPKLRGHRLNVREMGPGEMPEWSDKLG